MDRVEVQPASVAQVRRALSGRMVAIDADVGDVARQLAEIDPCLRVHHSLEEGIYIVFRRYRNAKGQDVEDFVTTARQLDGRLVARIREIGGRGYDYAKELERAERAAERARDRDFREQVGERSERLAHALRKDLGLTKPTFFKDPDAA